MRKAVLCAAAALASASCAFCAATGVAEVPEMTAALKVRLLPPDARFAAHDRSLSAVFVLGSLVSVCGGALVLAGVAVANRGVARGRAAV